MASGAASSESQPCQVNCRVILRAEEALEVDVVPGRLPVAHVGMYSIVTSVCGL